MPSVFESTSRSGSSPSQSSNRRLSLPTTTGRRLVGANPAVFEPDLSMAFNNLGMGLSNLGRREQAFRATEEVEGRQRLKS